MKKGFFFFFVVPIRTSLLYQRQEKGADQARTQCEEVLILGQCENELNIRLYKNRVHSP